MIVIKNKSRKVASTADKIIKVLIGLAMRRVSSLTLYSRSDFAKHENIAEKLDKKIFL